MGIGFLLIVGGATGLIAAAIASAILRHRVEVLTSRASTSRDGVLRTAAMLPFACLAWAGFVFAFEATINGIFLGRDPGLGDYSECPLPNGYALRFVDTTTIGDLYRAKRTPDDPNQRTIENVRLLQLAGTYALAAQDSHARQHFGQDDNQVDQYFLVDMRSGDWETLGTLTGLRSAAQARGIHMSLEPVGSLYFRYRWTWFDLAALILLVAPPIAGYVELMRRAKTLNSTT